MGHTYAHLKIANLFNQKAVEITALVDTGATFMGVTEEIALQLGFNISEVSQQVVVNPLHPNFPVALAKQVGV